MTDRLFHLAAAVLIVAATVHGVRTTGDLAWPIDPDQFRDIAQAQTIRDGHWLQDPFYRGEWVWYSPLLPAAIAATGAITGRPTHIAATRGGAYLDALAPITFYALAVALIGPGGALVALAAFIFLGGSPPWGWPTYSPWLFAAGFAQALFYVTLLALYRASRSKATAPFAAVGALLGLTFLAHTAPAVLVGIAAVALLGARARNDQEAWRPAGVQFAALLLTAIVVAAPFLVAIVGRYHLHILNPVPLLWTDPATSLGNWRRFLWAVVDRPLLNVTIAFGISGLLRRRNAPASIVVGAWGLASIGLFVYTNYVWAAMHDRGINLPPLLPSYHFLFYERAVETLLAGAGAAAIVALAAERLIHDARSRLRLERGLIAATAAAVVLIGFPGFIQRDDFTKYRAQSLETFRAPEFRGVMSWIRANAAADDVFMTAESAALSIVGPNGRKSVVTPQGFSNPYVDWGARATAQQAMWRALDANDCAAFTRLATLYSVRWVMTAAQRTPDVAPGRCGLEPTSFPGTGLRIFRVRLAAGE